jgi:hypothetical protein
VVGIGAEDGTSWRWFQEAGNGFIDRKSRVAGYLDRHLYLQQRHACGPPFACGMAYIRSGPRL